MDDRMGLGPIGAWVRSAGFDPEQAGLLERLGYGALWLGGSPGPDLAGVEAALGASERLPVATGIVPIWAASPRELAGAFHRVESAYPGRLLLGLGTAHRERWGEAAAKPYDALVAYLDALEAAGVPPRRIVLAALGPRTLRLAAERTAGAHPFLTPVAHTREARAILGDDALLAPEQRVVLEADPERARAIARPTIQTPYLELVNYRRNLQRLGYTDADLADGGSDRLVDDLAAWGDDAAVAARVRAHLDAGADHVAVQLLQPDGGSGYARVAAALGLG